MADSGDKQALLESEKVWSHHARITAQTAILINGGAATAVLAFASRSAAGDRFTKLAAIALLVYAIGVLIGAICVLFVTRGAGWTSSYWSNLVEGAGARTLNSDYNKSQKEYGYAEYAFYASLLMFFGASVLLAVSVLLG